MRNKLTPDLVAEVKVLLKSLSFREIADKVNLSHSTISYIKNGRKRNRGKNKKNTVTMAGYFNPDHHENWIA